MDGLDQDVQVQGTNDDAQISKLSCVRLGYFQDPFVHLFVRKAARRSPLIHRGYYSRFAALRQLMAQYLDAQRAAGEPSQVLVLGAGFDTTWFQLSASGRAPTRTLELDFAQVTRKKVATVVKHQELWKPVVVAHQQRQPHGGASSSEQQGTGHSSAAPAAPAAPPASQAQPAQAPGTAAPSHLVLQPPLESRADASASTPPGLEARHNMPAPGHTILPPPAEHAAHRPQPPVLFLPRSGAGHGAPGLPDPLPAGLQVDARGGLLVSEAYSILPVDLRDCAAVEQALARAGFDPSVPTFVLSECVLVYMELEASSALLSMLARTFGTCTVAIYEQIKPDDAFGRQMVTNLEARGLPLKGLAGTPTLEAQCTRLLRCGWHTACAWDMDAVYTHHLEPRDKARCEALEVFDELEEWHMIQQHYSVCLGLQEAVQHKGRLIGTVGFGQEGRASAEAAA